MAKNHVVTSTKAPNLTEAQVIPVGNPPPSANAPAPPKGWAKSRWVRPRQGLKPTSDQTSASPGAAAELRASTTWVEDFGSKGPSPRAMADTLETASEWRAAWTTARDWLDYCSEQRRLWEDAAFSEIAELSPVFDYADARDPSIAKRYPSVRRIVNARSDVAQRSAATRAKAKQKQRAAALAPATLLARTTAH